MIDVGESQVQGVGEVIRLAVAPVFLLSGVGIMLTVFTNRLARAVDRARTLEREAAAEPAEARALELHQSLAVGAPRDDTYSVSATLNWFPIAIHLSLFHFLRPGILQRYCSVENQLARLRVGIEREVGETFELVAALDRGVC